MQEFSNEGGIPISERWEELDKERKDVVNKTVEFAKLTIPALIIPDGETPDGATLDYPFDSVGASAVNNLVNKVAMTLMHPATPFFKLSPTAEYAQELRNFDESSYQAALSAITSAEQQAIDTINSKRMRPLLYRLLLQLVVTGNALLILKKKEAPVLRTLRNYAVVLSDDKKLLELVIKRTVFPPELDAKLSGYVKDTDNETPVDIYVRVFWNGEEYEEYAGINDEIVTDAAYSATYTEETLPYNVLHWESVDGASYGIGQVEMYAGDLRAISRNTEAAVTLALIKREIRFLVSPESMIDVAELNDSKTGDFIVGDGRHISTWVPAANTELSEIFPVIEGAIRRISQGFMMASGVIRDAERVTAAEVRQMSMELETGLGGVYSRLAHTLQHPIVKWILDEINLKAFELEGINVQITTGMDALGRKYDNSTLLAFINDAVQLGSLPPEVASFLKVDILLTQLANGYGIDESKVIRTVEEREIEQAKAQSQQLLQRGAEEGIKNISNPPPIQNEPNIRG